jgi:NADPH:quinone reductase-like Zn-dependent oxidoreductase
VALAFDKFLSSTFRGCRKRLQNFFPGVFQSFVNIRPHIFLFTVFYANAITVFRIENGELKRFHLSISLETGFPVSLLQSKNIMTADLFDVVASGAVKIQIHARMPLAEAAEAHRNLEARHTAGATILLP